MAVDGRFCLQSELRRFLDRRPKLKSLSRFSDLLNKVLNSWTSVPGCCFFSFFIFFTSDIELGMSYHSPWVSGGPSYRI